jgi:hypothetical protein
LNQQDLVLTHQTCKIHQQELGFQRETCVSLVGVVLVTGAKISTGWWVEKPLWVKNWDDDPPPEKGESGSGEFAEFSGAGCTKDPQSTDYEVFE